MEFDFIIKEFILKKLFTQSSTTTIIIEAAMEEKEESPILKKEIKKFLEENPKIKTSLEIFKISEDQYLKALQSTQPQITTSNKNVIEITA